MDVDQWSTTGPSGSREELEMTKPESAGKPFDISKREVWEAYQKVKENQGAPGVDKQTLEDFAKDLAGNLYKVWNRMSSGSYFPPPVLAVEIPKPHGGGTRRNAFRQSFRASQGEIHETDWMV